MMRLTIATVLLAGFVAAHPQSVEGARGHDAIAKRQRERSLNVTFADVHIPHAIRFPGDHDLDDVPEGLEYDLADSEEHNPAWFADFADDDWESQFAGLESANETKIITDREWEEELQTRQSKLKRGLAWTNEVEGSLHLMGKLFGVYTWTEWWPEEAKKLNMPFFPMLKTYEKRDLFKSKVNNKNYGAGIIMAPNEVNLKSQANMSPSRAAWIMRTYMIPLKKKWGWKIVGPSTANGPSAITWYKELKRIAPDVWNQIDIINLHYYGLDAGLVTKWMDDWYAMFRKDIWLTEYGCYSFTGKGKCTASQAQNFMRTIATFCNRKSWCKSHMIYGAYVNSRTGMGTVNALYKSKSSLSNLGKAYLSI